MCFKQHVEKVHEIEQSHKSAKAQIAIRVVLKKSGSNHHTMIASKRSDCLICYQILHKNVSLRAMLAQFMKMRTYKIVGFVMKVFLINVF